MNYLGPGSDSGSDEACLDENDYDHAKDHLIGLRDDIYKTGNLQDLEFHLEEVLRVFGIKIPQTPPVLMNANQKPEPMLKGWVDFTRAYADTLTQ